MADDNRAFLAGRGREGAADRSGGAIADAESEAMPGVVCDPRRWKTVRILEDERDRTIDRRAIARRIATDGADDRASPDRRVRRIEISLHHKHLPMLDDAGVVDYEPDTGLVTYTPCPDFERQVQAIVE